LKKDGDNGSRRAHRSPCEQGAHRKFLPRRSRYTASGDRKRSPGRPDGAESHAGKDQIERNPQQVSCRLSEAVPKLQAAFGTLCVSFYPYVIPRSVTLMDAVAPQSTLSFMFWGAGLFVLPITIVYTLLVYFIFKVKVSLDQHGHY
jgi:hypothetical protein